MTNWAVRERRARRETWWRVRFSDPDYTPTLDDRIAAIIANPDFFRIADAFPEPNPDGAGAPCGYPNWVWIIMNAMTGVFGSQRKVSDYLRANHTWEQLLACVAEQHGTHHIEAIAATSPSRSTWRHHNKRIEQNFAAVQNIMEQCALEQAQQQGCLKNPKRSTTRVPQRGDIVSGDGTVTQAAINKKTADKNPKKYADAFGLHIEGGEEKGVFKYGVKFIDLSCRFDDGRNSRIILAFRRQEASRSGKEAEQALDMLHELQKRSGDTIHGLTWDGALRGKHRRALLKSGIIPITPHHGGAKPRRYPDPHPGMDLWTYKGALCDRRITVTGETQYIPLTLIKTLPRPNKNGEYRWYGQYVHPETGDTLIARWHTNPTDDASKYNRAEHLQPYPKGSEQYEEAYGRRSDAESTHSELDNRLFRGRMIAFSPTRQNLVMLWFMLAQNSLARYVFIHRVNPEKPANR